MKRKKIWKTNELNWITSEIKNKNKIRIKHSKKETKKLKKSQLESNKNRNWQQK